MTRFRGRPSTALPILLLATAALLFHRDIVFRSGFAVPWDLRSFHLPLDTAYADALREGTLPLWDPYPYWGRPLLANPQTAVFYPTVFLAALGGREGLLYRLELVEVFHVFLAGLFTYLLARRLGLGMAAALTAGFIFELGGFLASQVEHLDTICGAPWLPLAWLALLLAPRWRIPVLASALALHFLAGFANATIAAGAATLLFAVLLWLADRRRTGVLVSVPVAAVLAAGLAAAQLLPTLELVRNSVGKYRTDWLNAGGGMPPGSLLSMVWPNYWGVFDMRTFHAPYDITMMFVYVSIAGLVLALLALFRRFPNRAVLASMAGICGILMLGSFTPVGRLLYYALPLSLRNAVYWYPFVAPFELAVALLAGWGAELWLPSERLRWAVAAVIAADLILAGSNRPMNHERITDEPVATGNTIDRCASCYRQLEDAAGEGRYDTADDGLFLSNVAAILRLRCANTYDPLALERMTRARLTFAKGTRAGAFYAVQELAAPTVGLMSIRAVTHRGAIPAPRLQGTPWIHFADGPEGVIYVNPDALPRYRVVGRVHGASDMMDAYRFLRGIVTHASLEDVAEGFRLDSDAAGTARILRESRNQVQIETDATGPAYLATSEIHYPGWTATVDGRPASVYYTNVAFRGIPIPAGSHRVEFRFQAPALMRGLWISSLAILIWLVLVFRAAHPPNRTAARTSTL
jgi:hypothetical protein